MPDELQIDFRTTVSGCYHAAWPLARPQLAEKKMGGSALGRRSNEEERTWEGGPAPEKEAWEGGPTPNLLERKERKCFGKEVQWGGGGLGRRPGTKREQVLWEGGPMRRKMLGKEARPQLWEGEGEGAWEGSRPQLAGKESGEVL